MTDRLTIIPGLTHLTVARIGTMMMIVIRATDTIGAVITTGTKSDTTSKVFATRAKASKTIGSTWEKTLAS